MTKFDHFMTIYAEELRSSVAAHPSDYAYGLDTIPTVVAKMRAAIASYTPAYNLRPAPALAATCKRLGIKLTYKAIREFTSVKEREGV